MHSISVLKQGIFPKPLRIKAILLSLNGALIDGNNLILALVLEPEQCDVEGSDLRYCVLWRRTTLTYDFVRNIFDNFNRDGEKISTNIKRVA